MSKEPNISSTDPRRRSLVRPVSLLVALVAVGVKLWLVRGQALSALGSSPHDDEHFVRAAVHLASGGWLGPYDELTLMKGPLYPIWIAASSASRIPLLLSEHLLYAIACAVLVWAIAPLLWGRVYGLLLFTVLLLNPASFADGPATRVMREGIYPALSLLVLATAAGTALRTSAGRRASMAWAGMLGICLVAYWTCREERAWLLPSLCLIWIATLAAAPRAWPRLLLATAIGGLVLLIGVGAVERENRSRYGVGYVTEFTEGPFPGAYAALISVQGSLPSPRVPLPAEARRRLYPASPSLGTLQPFLEGSLGAAWTRWSCEGSGVCDDMAGGWMMWALRDAARHAGHYRDAPSAAAYWNAVRSEVATACRSGAVSCAWHPLAFVPPWRSAENLALLRAFGRGGRTLLRFDDCRAAPSPSRGPPANLELFREVTRERLASEPGAARVAGSARIRALQAISAIYGLVAPFLFLIAIGLLVLALVGAVRRRRVTVPLGIAVALLVAIVVRVGLLAIIDVTSFPALGVLYLSAAHPPLLAFLGIAPLTLGAAPE